MAPSKPCARIIHTWWFVAVEPYRPALVQIRQQGVLAWGPCSVWLGHSCRIHHPFRRGLEQIPAIGSCCSARADWWPRRIFLGQHGQPHTPRGRPQLLFLHQRTAFRHARSLAAVNSGSSAGPSLHCYSLHASPSSACPEGMNDLLFIDVSHFASTSLGVAGRKSLKMSKAALVSGSSERAVGTQGRYLEVRTQDSVGYSLCQSAAMPAGRLTPWYRKNGTAPISSRRAIPPAWLPPGPRPWVPSLREICPG